MSETGPRYRAGGWGTHRGEEEGILVHAYKPQDYKNNMEIWFDKRTATRFAHTVLEAQMRFWDIEWEPKYLRRNLKDAAQSIGMEVTEPYRAGCPFCEYVADTEDEMRQHLKDEHEIHLILVEAAEG